MRSTNTGSTQHPFRRGMLCVTLAGCLLGAAACSNDWGTATPEGAGAADTTPAGGGASAAAAPTSALAFGGQKVAVTAPGVSDTEIRVSGIGSLTNPLGMKINNAFEGVQSYFDMVNAQGGIYGRKLVMGDKLDDNMISSDTQAQRIVSEGNSFAVLPVATPLFTGADTLAKAGIPTFGWLINPEWGSLKGASRPNLFGASGGVLCAECTSPGIPYLAKQAGKHKIGMLAYSIAQAQDCVTGTESSFEKYGPAGDAKVVYSDKSLQFGVSDLSIQVSKMKEQGVDLVFTCGDFNLTVTLAKEMKKQGMEASQLVANAYDQEFMDEYGDLFEGSYVRTDFATVEAKPQSAGMQRFLEWQGKAGRKATDNSIVGWINADLFVAGLLAAGPDFSQKGVVDAINTKLTNYDAAGLVHPINWSTAHAEQGVACNVYSRVENSKFTVPFGTDKSPFLCIKDQNGQQVNVA